MTDGGLARKLLLRPGMRLLVTGDPGGYTAAIAGAEPGLSVGSAPPPGGYDAGLLFAADRAAFQAEIGRLIEAVVPHGPVWVAYRKQPKSDLNRNGVLELTKPFDWRPVTQVAIDERWSAMRLRPIADVGR